MTLKNIKDVKRFQNVIDKCEDDVWLISDSDYFNLKSAISQLIAIGRILTGDKSLELFTAKKEDEWKFLKMFNEYPEMM